MNQFPAINPTHPEWEAPKDGDFAGYVERLTAPHRVQLPREPGRVLHVAESLQRVRPSEAPNAHPEPKDLQAQKAPLAGALHFVQLGLVLVVLAQVAVLALAGLGSAFGVALAVLAWWVVGRWKRALDSALVPSAPAGSPFSALSALQQRLQALAEQKSTTLPRK